MAALRNKEKGGALLIVLWMSAALAAIGLSVATTVSTEVDHTSTVADGLRAHYLASGSVERFIQWMSWGGQRNPDGSARYWEPRQTLYLMRYGSGDVVVQTISETAKLNVNSASEDDLAAVVAGLTGDPFRGRAVAQAILHWRQGGAGQAGPLDAYYLGLGPTFQPRRASFQEIEELMFVRGVTPELFYGSYMEDAQGRLYARGGLRDCLSVWGGASVDVNGADPAVLAAIGMEPGYVQAVVRRRAAQPFATMKELQDLGIPLNRLSLNLTSMWTVRATARLRNPDGSRADVVRSSAAVVKFWQDNKPHASLLQVVRFYQDAWSESMVRPQ